MRKLLIPALALLAAPAAAQENPAAPEQISEAIDACKAITFVDRLELEKLRALGWKYYEKRGARSMIRVAGAYQKEGNEALIIISKESEKANACAVFARLDSTADYGPTAQGVSEIVGMPVRAEGPTYFWILGDSEVRLDPAGDRDKPIARFEITAIPQESAE